LGKEKLYPKDNQEGYNRSIKESKDIRTELDRRAFYLKTLYDISLEICGTVEIDVILKNFLLMTMGNFGIVQGFLFAMHLPTKETYCEFKRGLPRVGKRVATTQGEGKVIRQNTMNRTVTVELEGGEEVTIRCEDIQSPKG